MDFMPQAQETAGVISPPSPLRTTRTMRLWLVAAALSTALLGRIVVLELNGNCTWYRQEADPHTESSPPAGPTGARFLLVVGDGREGGIGNRFTELRGALYLGALLGRRVVWWTGAPEGSSASALGVLLQHLEVDPAVAGVSIDIVDTPYEVRELLRSAGASPPEAPAVWLEDVYLHTSLARLLELRLPFSAGRLPSPFPGALLPHEPFSAQLRRLERCTDRILGTGVGALLFAATNIEMRLAANGRRLGGDWLVPRSPMERRHERIVLAVQRGLRVAATPAGRAAAAAAERFSVHHNVTAALSLRRSAPPHECSSSWPWEVHPPACYQSLPYVTQHLLPVVTGSSAGGHGSTFVSLFMRRDLGRTTSAQRAFMTFSEEEWYTMERAAGAPLVRLHDGCGHPPGSDECVLLEWLIAARAPVYYANLLSSFSTSVLALRAAVHGDTHYDSTYFY